MDHTELRHSPLDDRHRALGASMMGFGGWDMPLDYGSVVAEHRAVRDSCGAFDLSHLGTLRVTGRDAEACVQRAFTNDVTALDVGRAHYTLCCTPEGGIVDDLLVYRLEWGLFVVPNAANAGAVAQRLRECAADLDDAVVTDVKADLACIALQGPDSLEIAAQLGAPVDPMGYLDVTEALGGVVARSGYTGERGVELFVPGSAAGEVWDAALAAGATPAGLGARDTLRLEMGYPLHGNDISLDTSPVEARLGWAVKLGTGFVGEDAVAAAKEAGPSRTLRGLRVTERGIPRAGCDVLLDGDAVGTTTSGTFSPTLGSGIAMGYLDVGVELGAAVEISVRAKTLAAEVVRPPFVDRDPKA